MSCSQPFRGLPLELNWIFLGFLNIVIIVNIKKIITLQSNFPLNTYSPHKR